MSSLSFGTLVVFLLFASLVSLLVVVVPSPLLAWGWWGGEGAVMFPMSRGEKGENIRGLK